MFKRALILGLFALITLMPATAQDTAHNWLLLTRYYFGRLETIVSKLDMDTGTLEDVFTVATPHTAFSMSPNGDKLAYFAMLPANRSTSEYTDDITYYVQDVFGGEAQIIATHGVALGTSSFYSATLPAWSPDGTHILVVNRDEQNQNDRYTIFDVETGETTLIRPAPTSVRTNFVWSPDGSMLAAYIPSCNLCGPGTIYVFSAAGDITPHPLLDETDLYPDNSETLVGWLLNSREVIIRRGENYLNTDDRSSWLRVNVETGEFEKIAPDSKFEAYCAQIRLLDSSTAQIIGNYQGELMLDTIDLETEGENLPQLLNSPSPTGSCQQVFSPDSTRIAIFNNLGHGNYAIQVYDLTTGKQQAQIPTVSYSIGAMLWTPDGESIVYQYNTSADGVNKTQIFTAKTDGSDTPHLIAEIDAGQYGWYGNLLGWMQSAPE